MRALPVAVTLMDQVRAQKRDTGLGNRLTDPADPAAPVNHVGEMRAMGFMEPGD